MEVVRSLLVEIIVPAALGRLLLALALGHAGLLGVEGVDASDDLAAVLELNAAPVVFAHEAVADLIDLLLVEHAEIVCSAF
jgi:hypothetical protein